MTGPGEKKGAVPTWLLFDPDVTADDLVAAVQRAASTGFRGGGPGRLTTEEAREEAEATNAEHAAGIAARRKDDERGTVPGPAAPLSTRRRAVADARKRPKPVPPGVLEHLTPSARRTREESEELHDYTQRARDVEEGEEREEGRAEGHKTGRVEGHEEGRAAQRTETSKKGSGARTKKARDRDATLLDDLVALVADGERYSDSIAAKLGVSARKLDDLWKEGVKCGRLGARPHGRPRKAPRR